jgi:AraC-like DNA-binding protein
MAHNSVVYLPKSSFVLLKTANIKTRIVNYWSTERMCDSDRAFYFVADGPEVFSGLGEIQNFLNNHPRHYFNDAGISPASLSLKKYIDGILREDRRLGDFKSSDGLSRGTLTYHFKNDFGLTPKEYLTRARVISSTYDLVSGKSIADSAFKSGFSDLSRYYKNFKKFYHVAPGDYRIKSDSAS